jgi:hypothetical protein
MFNGAIGTRTTSLLLIFPEYVVLGPFTKGLVLYGNWLLYPKLDAEDIYYITIF